MKHGGGACLACLERIDVKRARRRGPQAAASGGPLQIEGPEVAQVALAVKPTKEMQGQAVGAEAEACAGTWANIRRRRSSLHAKRLCRESQTALGTHIIVGSEQPRIRGWDESKVVADPTKDDQANAAHHCARAINARDRRWEQEPLGGRNPSTKQSMWTKRDAL